MVRKYIIYAWAMLIALSVATQTIAQPQQSKMTAVFNYATFNMVDGDPYVETYIDYDVWNLTFIPTANGQHQVIVETILTVSSGDSIVFDKKYDLNYFIYDTSKANFNMVDVQRIPLKNGIYNLRIELRDKGSEALPVVIDEKIEILYDRNPKMSDLGLFSTMPPTQDHKLSHGGYKMEPYVNEYIPAEVSQIYYYYEIYHIDRELFSNEFSTLAYIEQQETGHKIPGFENTKNHTGAPSIPVSGVFNLSKLPNGNYNLVVEVHNKENLLMKQKIDFIRNNPGVSAADLLPISNSFAGRITDENDLNFYLKNLYPIGNAAENEYAINLTKRSGLIADKQLFLYTFWMQRNSRAPESEWLKYKERIDYVAANFAHSNSSGYLTDMGQIYLKYGAPNFVREEKNFIGTQNIHYLPFKMWRYDQLPNNPPNRMFIFWDQYRSGLYTLLNSNANGEKTNPDWERELSQKQLGDGSIGDVGKAFERGY